MRLGIIDYLRGTAIFSIVIMHLTLGCFEGFLGKLLLYGGAGVHVFFMCSGFGLYLSYLHKPISYWAFLKRRFSRLYIPYAIVVIIWGGWHLCVKGAFPAKELSAHLLLYKMFSEELDTSLCYPFWFISTIIQFYLVWPIIQWLYRVGGVKCSILISLTWSTMVGVFGLEDQLPWSSFFLQYLWEFCLGMWFAEIISSNTKCSFLDASMWSWKWLIIIAMGGACITGLMSWKGGVFKLYNDILHMDKFFWL